MIVKAKTEWIKDVLVARGYAQRDVAKSWGVSEASVSRFLSGTENQDLPFSRACDLAQMLDMGLDEFAQRVGYRRGKTPPPPIVASSAPPIGTTSLAVAEGGRLRVLLHLDLPAPLAGELVALLGRASEAQA